MKKKLSFLIEKFGWIFIMLSVFWMVGWIDNLFPNRGYESKDVDFLDFLIIMFSLFFSLTVCLIFFSGVSDMIGYSSEFGWRSKKSRYRIISTKKKIFIIGLFFFIYIFPLLF